MQNKMLKKWADTGNHKSIKAVLTLGERAKSVGNGPTACLEAGSGEEILGSKSIILAKCGYCNGKSCKNKGLQWKNFENFPTTRHLLGNKVVYTFRIP